MSYNHLDEKNDAAKHPEVIIIDDANEHLHEPGDWIKDNEEIAEIQNFKFPFAVRILSLISLFLTGAFTLVLASAFLFTFALATLFLYQNKKFNEITNQLWSFLKTLLVLCLGFALSIFSPLLGFSLIILHYTMSSNQPGKSFVTKTYKNFF